MTILVLIFSIPISMAFVPETTVAIISSRGLKIIGIGYLCYMLTNIFTGKMAGLGRVNQSMILMFVYYIVIRVPLAIMWIAILASHLAAILIAFVLDRYMDRSAVSRERITV